MKESSNIKNLDYDEKTKVLTVTFKTGSNYSYHGVTPQEFHAFNNADSLGKHFHANFKSKSQKKSNVQK